MSFDIILIFLRQANANKGIKWSSLDECSYGLWVMVETIGAFRASLIGSLLCHHFLSNYRPAFCVPLLEDHLTFQVSQSL
jgi:hypothetical protein